MTDREKRVVWFLLAVLLTVIVVSASWLMVLGPNAVAAIVFYVATGLLVLIVVLVPKGGLS